MRTTLIRNQSNPTAIPILAKYCDTTWCRFWGLMFQPNIKKGAGLLLIESKESRMAASIHMMFMRFDICAIWINNNLEVVDAKLVKRWAIISTPSAPGRYILETHTHHLSDFQIGDQLVFSND